MNYLTENKRVIPVSSAALLSAQCVESSEIDVILSEVDSHTMVVFDIDYTLFRSSTSLGTPEWYQFLIDEDILIGGSLRSSFEKWYPAWLKAQEFNEIVLIDAHKPTFLKEIERKSACCIALTARGPVCKKITDWQLEKVGLAFNDFFTNAPFYRKFKYPTLYSNGIIFSHDLNQKEQVLEAWLKPFVRKNQFIKKVVFIDDLEKNVISVKNVVSSLGLEYLGVRYSAGDSYKKKFSSQGVGYQASILLSSRLNKKIRKLL